MAAASPMYEDFVPTTELLQEEDADTLVLYLPGFKKEHLKVQLTKEGILRISGSKQIVNNKWSRFLKEFPVSTNTDTNKITAKFEGGKMYVRQPKLIIPASKTAESHKPAVEPQAPKSAPEQPLTARKNDHEKGLEKVEEKTTDTKSNGSTDAKNGKETNLAETSSSDKKANDKPKPDSINAAAIKDKITTGIEDGAGKTRLTNYMDISRGMAARLKMPRRVMNAVVVVLLAVLVGLYVSNWIKSCKKIEN